jgi:hypothetical protein
MSVSGKPSAVPPVATKRVPDFFIVGHAKSGTTALFEMLRRHPQIYMPDVKETQFFARNLNPPRDTDGAISFDQTGRHAADPDEYFSLFTAARSDHRVGEASTFYLWSHTAPARIAEAQPDARIIAILREPASFLRSLHLQMVQNHRESEKDLRAALSLEDARRQGRDIPRHAYWPSALIYSDRVRYVEQLRRYYALFPSEQILVLIYDDFRRDNEATVRRVLRFLDVDETAPIDVTDANPTVRVRSVWLDRMVRALRVGESPVARAVTTSIKTATTRQLRRKVLYPLRLRVMYGNPRPPDETLMAELRSRFKGEVVAASEYLERDLVSLWGYDRVV